jgi:hypothetical protein
MEIVLADIIEWHGTAMKPHQYRREKDIGKRNLPEEIGSFIIKFRATVPPNLAYA